MPLLLVPVLPLTADAKTGDYAKITETGKKFIENIKKPERKR